MALARGAVRRDRLALVALSCLLVACRSRHRALLGPLRQPPVRALARRGGGPPRRRPDRPRRDERQRAPDRPTSLVGWPPALRAPARRLDSVPRRWLARPARRRYDTRI